MTKYISSRYIWNKPLGISFKITNLIYFVKHNYVLEGDAQQINVIHDILIATFVRDDPNFTFKTNSASKDADIFYNNL